MNPGRWLREPLLQFLLLGALIFAADYLLNGRESTSGNYQIHVTAGHLDALRASFKAEKGRLPSDAELQVRLQQWLDEEMLYQEARALGLERRDAIVRRQMVQKMRFLLADATPIPVPSEAELRSFMEANAVRYGHSPRLDFQQVFLSRGRHAENMTAAVREIIGKLEAAPDDFEGLGDVFATGQSISGFDETAIRREFGREFHDRLMSLPDGQWQGPVASSLGLHMVRITARSDYRPALLEEVRGRVENDWRLEQREQANARAMQKLRDRFRIEYEVVQGLGAG